MVDAPAIFDTLLMKVFAAYKSPPKDISYL